MARDIVTYASDRGPGNAWLALAGAVSPDVRIAVKRVDTSTKTYLGPRGWQDPRTTFAASAVDPLPQGTRVLLGPQICNLIEADIEVLVEVEDSAFAGSSWTSAPFLWPEIKRSGRMGGAGILREEPKPVEPAQPRRSAAPRPNGGNDAKRSDGGHQSTMGPEQMPAPVGGSPIEEPIPEPPVASTRWRGSTFAWMIVVLALTAALGGAGFYVSTNWPEPWCGRYGMFCEQTARTTPQQQPAALDPDIAPTVNGGPESWIAAIGDPGTPAERLMRLGLALRRPGADPVALNTGFEAIYAAGYARGEPQALLWLGQAYDPSLPADETRADVDRSALSALDYYRRAADRNADAGRAMANLCSWLKERQFQGNSDARQVYETQCQVQ